MTPLLKLFKPAQKKEIVNVSDETISSTDFMKLVGINIRDFCYFKHTFKFPKHIQKIGRIYIYNKELALNAYYAKEHIYQSRMTRRKLGERSNDESFVEQIIHYGDYKNKHVDPWFGFGTNDF
jgi:hypothetical protein